MSETPTAACKNCDQPIRLSYGIWVHTGRTNDPFANAPFCEGDGFMKAEPYEGDA